MTVDRLLRLDPADGSFVDLGKLRFEGLSVREGEDLEFGENGVLFVTDNDDDELFQIELDFGDPDRAILDMKVAIEQGSSIKMEGLAFDFETGRLIGTDDVQDLFFELLLGGEGALATLGRIDGLTDVEGIDFIPEPSSGMLLAAAMVILGITVGRRRRARTRARGARVPGRITHGL